MITRKGRLRKYCKEFQNIENYEEAVKSTERYELHHRKEIDELDDCTVVRRSRKELLDTGLYWNRPAEELIFLKCSEHKMLHNKGKKYSIETKAKISEANSGKKHSPEARAKISEANRGRKYSLETRAKISSSEYGSKNHQWKGDLATDHSKYMRLRNLMKRKEKILATSSSRLSES